MLKNARVTAFTVSELLMEIQQGGKSTPIQIRVNKTLLKLAINYLLNSCYFTFDSTCFRKFI